MAEADPALAIANHDKRSKTEALAALDGLGDAVDVNQLLDQLFAAFFAIAATTTLAIVTTTAAIAAAAASAVTAATATTAATISATPSFCRRALGGSAISGSSFNGYSFDFDGTFGVFSVC
jgi:hypothetical protein